MSRALRSLSLAALVLALGPLAHASAQASATITFSQYLDRVLDRNLDLVASRRDVTAAEARVQIGARLPDPTISGGLVSFDISHPTGTERRSDTVPGSTQPVCGYASSVGGPLVPCRTQLPTVVGVSIDVPIELGDQQGARMDVARVGVTQAGTGVDDSVRVLRGQAGGFWVDALATQLDLDRLRQTLASLEALVEMNRARVDAGAIGDVELVQSRVEAQMFRAQVLIGEGSARAALLGLGALLAADEDAVPTFAPIGDLGVEPVTFDLAQLVEQAMQNRPDLRRIQLDIDAARASRRLAEAQRWGAIDVMASWLYSVPGTDTQFGQTDYHAVGLMVAIPLPFRLLWHGELDEANAMEAAADARYAQARQRLEVEIRQVLTRYDAAVQARALFDQSVIADAERVLEATRYQYEHGGASLVAVLVAQRTVNEVYAAYIDAQQAHAHALVDVETAAGIWDIDFDSSHVPPAAPPPAPPSAPSP
jgi:cobalt-zinc-cadmium efflux system outer membrane protein